MTGRGGWWWCVLCGMYVCTFRLDRLARIGPHHLRMKEFDTEAEVFSPIWSPNVPLYVDFSFILLAQEAWSLFAKYIYTL